MKRIKAAFRTSDTQATAVLMLTGLNMAAVLSAKNSSITDWIFWAALLFYPVLAFVSNLISPLPERKSTK